MAIVDTTLLRDLASRMQPPEAARAHAEAAGAIETLDTSLTGLQATVVQLTRRIEGLESRVSALESA